MVLGSLLRRQNIGNITKRVVLMSKYLENCWWLCNTNRNYILTHLINVYKSIKLSWKWVKTRKQILLFHWRCRNFNTPSLVKPSTKIGNSLRRFKHSNNSHATLNIFETAVDTEKFAPDKMFARNRAIRQFFLFFHTFFCSRVIRDQSTRFVWIQETKDKGIS